MSVRRRGRDGQTLVEFALIIPLFILLLTAVIEFALFFNALLAINAASRDSAAVAAEAGDEGAADCEILAAVDRNVLPPANPGFITNVSIYRSAANGTKLATSNYARSGSTTCFRPNGTSLTVPYSASGPQNYAPAVRCPRLSGCNGTTEIDQVGVEVTYVYSSHTPLGTLFGPSGIATLKRANVVRMEPVL